jgi:hypothetical protein
MRNQRQHISTIAVVAALWEMAALFASDGAALARRTATSPNSETQKPLAVLDGDKLYVHWPAATALTPATTAYDLARQQVLWTHTTESGDGNTLYVGRNSVISDPGDGSVYWLDRKTGRVLATAKRPKGDSWVLVAGDRVMIDRSQLYDTETGAALGAIKDINPYSWKLSADHLVDCLFRQEEGRPIWMLREFDRTTGELLRTINLAPNVEDKSTPIEGNSFIEHAEHGYVLSHLYESGVGQRCWVELATGRVVWLESSSFAAVFADRLFCRSRDPASDPSKQGHIFLHALDLATGEPLWKVQIPPTAPLILVGRNEYPLERPRGPSSAFIPPLYVDVDTGEVSTRPAHPTPLDRLAWQIGPFTLREDPRAFGDITVMETTPTSTAVMGSWYGWNTSTGDQVWSMRLDVEFATWLADMSANPRFIVLAAPREMQVVDLATGKKLVTLDPTVFGLTENISRPLKSASADSEGTAVDNNAGRVPMKAWFDNLLTPVLFIIVLALAWLWMRTRPPSPRERG